MSRKKRLLQKLVRKKRRKKQMKEIRRLFQHRNDYTAIWKCEHCKKELEAWGYRDTNFDVNVIPNAICPNCNKSAKGETKEQQIKRLGRFYELYKKF
jgi:ribosomal protein L37AE/L43A